MKKELVKRILGHLVTFMGGFIVGRLTKTAPMREIALDAHASDADMKAAAIHFGKIALTAIMEGTQMADGSWTPEELASVRESIVDSLVAQFSTDERIPNAGRLLLRPFLEWLFDPTQVPEIVSPEILRLTSDFGDFISKAMSEKAITQPQLLQEFQGIIDLLKPVLRRWESENRPDTYVRPLRHFIGAMAVVV